MTEPLEQTKRKLSKRYLGRNGIHGFGIDRQHQVINVYLTTGKESELDELRSELEVEAEPFEIRVISEGAPSLMTRPE